MLPQILCLQGTQSVDLESNGNGMSDTEWIHVMIITR